MPVNWPVASVGAGGAVAPAPKSLAPSPKFLPIMQFQSSTKQNITRTVYKILHYYLQVA